MPLFFNYMLINSITNPNYASTYEVHEYNAHNRLLALLCFTCKTRQSYELTYTLRKN
jgi:hypothetical protein